MLFRSADHKTPDICKALHISIAKRVSGQAKRVGLEETVVMTGGVAKNIGVVRELEKKLLCTIKIPEEPQIIGALGAAIIALENANADTKKNLLRPLLIIRHHQSPMFNSMMIKC